MNSNPKMPDMEKYKQEMIRQYQKSKSFVRSSQDTHAMPPASNRGNQMVPKTPNQGNHGMPQASNVEQDQRTSDQPINFGPSQMQQAEMQRQKSVNGSQMPQQKSQRRAENRPKNSKSFCKMEPLAYYDDDYDTAAVPAMAEMPAETMPVPQASTMPQTETMPETRSAPNGQPSPMPSDDPVLQMFYQQNPRQGYLRVQAFIGNEAFPIQGVQGVITKTIGGNRYQFGQIVTDENGQSETVPLPAPDKSLSETPHPKDGKVAYATYDLRLDRMGYAPVEIRDIPVFDGVVSLQPVALRIPSGSEIDRRNGVNIIQEQEPNL